MSLDDDGIKVTMVAGDPIEVEIAKVMAVSAKNGIADENLSIAVGAPAVGMGVALAIKAYRKEMSSPASPGRFDVEPEDGD